MNNGTGPTVQTIDGIEIDLNRISRREFVRLTNAIREALLGGDTPTRDELTGEMAALIVNKWPYEQPVSQDGYLSLGLLDSKTVDDALNEAMGIIGKKKSASSLTPLENSDSP